MSPEAYKYIGYGMMFIGAGIAGIKNEMAGIIIAFMAVTTVIFTTPH